VKIFVYEHVTGGGMADAPLPPGLLHEGELMLRTLLEELAARPGIELLTSRDARLPAIPGVESLCVESAGERAAVFARGVSAAAAVWPTAPETGGALEHLATEVERLGKALLGCRPAAVHVAASKRRTARALAAAGIPVVPTFTAEALVPDRSGRWITKPDDGAGSEDTVMAEDWRTALGRLRADPARLVAQPWLDGEPLSLSMLCADGQSLLLCCNRQRVRISGGRVTLVGLEVNVPVERLDELAVLAGRIVKAIPGLWGYVGVDFVMNDRGPVVLEVNPRLTTSYCGLGRALGINVAAKVLDLLEPGAVARWRRPRGGSSAMLDLEASQER
jgi:predicted ATP-grasp superfamily ATP-dependent carboligase